MENPGDIYQLCRLCLANKQVNVQIFGEKSDIRQISLKISSCLPVKIAADDLLPKNICEGCSDKLELFYAFWNSSQEADKTLRAWIQQLTVDTAGEAISAVVKQIANSDVIPLAVEQISNSEGIPLIPEVKEETEDPAEVLINQPFDDDEGVDEEEPEEAPPSKKARYSPTEEAINQESDDDDEEYGDAEAEPKIEDESDEEGDSDEDEPLSSFADKPGTSKDEDEAGPSGVGKDGEKVLDVESVIIKEEEVDISDVEESELYPDMPSFMQNYIKDTEVKKYKCELCLVSLRTKLVLDIHMNTHTKAIKYDCNQCPAVFYRPASAYKHRKAHDEFKATGVTCRVCNIWCRTLKSLKIHKRTHGARHECDMCPKTFQFINNLLAHKAAIHTKDGLLRCPFCEYKCIHKIVLLRHINRHTQEHKYRTTCTTCGKGFTSWKTLKMHIERVHQPKKDFHCDLCSSTFDTSLGLKIHKNRQHLMERRYICELCSKGFVSPHYLGRHMITHSDERNFQCTVCGIKYKRMGDLTRHLKTHVGK